MLTASSPELWLLLAFLAASTFCIRFAFFPLAAQWRKDGRAFRLLEPVPVAVLAALAAPGLFAPQAGGQLSAAGLLPAVAALLLARCWGNTLLSIGAGLAVFWLQHALGF